MSISYQAKDSIVLGRQLKVQKVTIPFSIVGSATAANVSISCDEPNIMFVKTEGVDQITAQLAAGETATYSVAPNDANGIFNVLLVIRSESVSKVLATRCVRYSATVANVTNQVVALGDADGLSSFGKIMLTIDSDVALNAGNTLAANLEVEYSVAE